MWHYRRPHHRSTACSHGLLHYDLIAVPCPGWFFEIFAPETQRQTLYLLHVFVVVIVLKFFLAVSLQGLTDALKASWTPGTQ